MITADLIFTTALSNHHQDGGEEHLDTIIKHAQSFRKWYLAESPNGMMNTYNRVTNLEYSANLENLAEQNFITGKLPGSFTAPGYPGHVKVGAGDYAAEKKFFLPNIG